MLKKLGRKIGRISSDIISQILRKKKRPASPIPVPLPSPPLPPSPSLSPPVSPPKMHHHHPKDPPTPFLFPKAQSTVLPDPSPFFSPQLLTSPLPTNSFFQNFVLKNGDQPEYIHPYLIKSLNSSLSISFPSRFATPAYIYQTFNADLTISSPFSDSPKNHIVSSCNDLSVTLDLPPSLRFFLVRGSPFVTCSTLAGPAPISISTIHAILSVVSNASSTKHTFRLNSDQTFVCYSSSPLYLTQSNVSLLTAQNFSGVIRITFLPDPSYESVLDRFSACYPVSGDASFSRPFCLEYKWKTKGWGDLLLLAHPLHLRLLSPDDSSVTVLRDFKYRSIDGELVGVVGDSWVLKT